MIQVGTRSRTTLLNADSDQGRQTRGLTRDLGMTKYYAGSVTFSSGGAVGGAGAFSAFAVGDVILVEGTNANNGYQAIESITGGDTITGDKGFVSETAAGAVIRTA